MERKNPILTQGLKPGLSEQKSIFGKINVCIRSDIIIMLRFQWADSAQTKLFWRILLLCRKWGGISIGERQQQQAWRTRLNMFLLDLCVAQGWQNVCRSLECTQEVAGHLSCHCISNHIGICQCRYSWTQDTNFGWRVYGGLRALSTQIQLRLLRRVSTEDQMTDAGKNPASNFLRGAPLPRQWLNIPSHYQKVLYEISLDPLSVDKQKRENFSRKSLNIEHKHGLGAEPCDVPVSLESSKLRKSSESPITKRQH